MPKNNSAFGIKRAIRLSLRDWACDEMELAERPEPNYAETVRALERLDRDEFFEKHVESVFIESMWGDSISAHHKLCSEVSKRWRVRTEFSANGMEFAVDENTPDDWIDICLDDCYMRRANGGGNGPFGPRYIDLTPDEAKSNLLTCNDLIEFTQQTVAETIKYSPEYRESIIGPYDKYLKWAEFEYSSIFKWQRRVKRYADVIDEAGEKLTAGDVEKYKTAAEERAKKKMLDEEW